MRKALQGENTELNDCTFTLLKDIVATIDPSVGFKYIDYALMIGAKPRGPGM